MLQCEMLELCFCLSLQPTQWFGDDYYKLLGAVIEQLPMVQALDLILVPSLWRDASFQGIPKGKMVEEVPGTRPWLRSRRLDV